MILMQLALIRAIYAIKGSPGNLQDFDDLLFEGAGQEAGRVAPVVMAVKVSTAAKDGAGVVSAFCC